MKKHCYTLLVFVFSISSFAQSNTFIDNRDGKVYKTVKIGLHTWIAENLAFKADSNCWAYDNDQNNLAKYGYLYNWETAKSVCPAGWHLPTKEEFESLIYNCADSQEEAYKAILPGGSTGFCALFAGWRTVDGYFIYKGKRAYFWSASLCWGENAWDSNMICHSGLCGFSVRCLKNN